MAKLLLQNEELWDMLWRNGESQGVGTLRKMFSRAFSGAQQRRLESCIFDCRKKRHAREQLEGIEQREVFQKKNIRSQEGRLKMKKCEEERTFGESGGGWD
jgi:hypothetical protein